VGETTIVSHWDHLIENFQYSPQEFYTALEERVRKRDIPKAELSRVTYKESGIFSGSREYLRVRRFEHIFDVCAAPFGQGFFVSWWLTEQKGCLASIPGVGPWLRPVTFYTHDTGIMFQHAVDGAVKDTVDAILVAKGKWGLTADEKKPVMRDFFRR